LYVNLLVTVSIAYTQTTVLRTVSSQLFKSLLTAVVYSYYTNCVNFDNLLWNIYSLQTSNGVSNSWLRLWPNSQHYV